jgi:hypothetical protein
MKIGLMFCLFITIFVPALSSVDISFKEKAKYFKRKQIEKEKLVVLLIKSPPLELIPVKELNSYGDPKALEEGEKTEVNFDFIKSKFLDKEWYNYSTLSVNDIKILTGIENSETNNQIYVLFQQNLRGLTNYIVRIN